MTFTQDFDRLRGRFRGTLLRPGEEGYDHTRQVWNGAIDRRPALIARCAGADDVATIVRFARDQRRPVSVRGGGHSVTGFGVVDDGIMIDLSPLKAVAVDPDHRTVRASGGMTWGEMDLATQRFGLATTGGSISQTGIGGVTLCGGFGHLMRRHGLAVDNLRAANLVTADGCRMRVDDEHDPELLWGLRGGGGNFGIVTSFEFDLHPVGPILYGGPIFWPLDQAPQVLRHLREFAPQAPDELGIAIVANLAPPMPFLPPQSYGRPVFGLLLSWSGNIADGIAATAELRSIGAPLGDAVRPVPYRALQSLLDGGAAGNHAYWRSQRLPGLSDDAIDVICARVESITSPLSLLNGWLLGGAAGRVDPAATAVGDRGNGYELRCVGVWRPSNPVTAADSGDADKHRAWVLEGWDALRPHSSGRQFASFLSDEGDAGVLAAYGDRLGRLRVPLGLHPQALHRARAGHPGRPGRPHGIDRDLDIGHRCTHDFRHCAQFDPKQSAIIQLFDHQLHQGSQASRHQKSSLQSQPLHHVHRACRLTRQLRGPSTARTPTRSESLGAPPTAPRRPG